MIDDEAPIRRFLRVPLEAEGHSVIEAATARDGILAVARETPGLVILDLGLPDADGLTVLREIRGWSQVPVLVLSVRADEAGKVAALDAGAQDYVVKPFGMKELLARIRSLLRDRVGAVAPAVDRDCGPAYRRRQPYGDQGRPAASPDPARVRPALAACQPCRAA